MDAQIAAVAQTMEDATPDCLVSGYEYLIEGWRLPDLMTVTCWQQRSLVIADAIVTWNEKDFLREVLDPLGIEVQTPDEFVLNQLMLEKLTALAALKRMRERWARPQYDASALVAFLEKRASPQTAAHLRDVVALI